MNRCQSGFLILMGSWLELSLAEMCILPCFDIEIAFSWLIFGDNETSPLKLKNKRK